MKVGLIKEIKDLENRVALTPQGAKALIRAGHSVLVEKDAGINSGFSDELYQASGCLLVDTPAAWSADLILKVKEPLDSEFQYFEEGKIVFTYLHLTGVEPDLTDHLLSKKVTAVAYETVRDKAGKLPLLAPMSGVAGAMSISIANYYLARFNGGKGVLVGEVLGRKHGKVVIVGDGVVGQHAAKMATGMGAETYLFSRHEDRFAKFRNTINSDLHCMLSTPKLIQEHLRNADAVIGAVLVPGARAPHVISKVMVANMQPGSVIVDVSIDQGGCIETSHPTSHSNPIFRFNDIIHYCVTNMPGAYPMTSTLALTSATLPYALRLADEGINLAINDAGFAAGINTHQGFITDNVISQGLSRSDDYKPLEELLI